MNPFVTLLIVLPLIGTVLVMLGLLATIIQEPQQGLIILFIIFGGIAAYLVKLFLRTGNAEGGTIELPVSPAMNAR